ncbi:hypothetical protein B0O99DRAFT_294855 [Bisporella sp. PMI_857]|nr:hypothetical protein B0O99DRAFT_294855 [Bisporella sp. PMI_857]
MVFSTTPRFGTKYILISLEAVYGSKWVVATRPSYLSCVWLLKACMLLYYNQIITQLNQLVAVVLTAVLLALTFIACMLTYFLECRPLSLAWQVLPNTPDCAKGQLGVIVMGSCNIATTLILMCIPVALIFRTRPSINNFTHLL